MDAEVHVGMEEAFTEILPNRHLSLMTNPVRAV